MTRAMSFVVVGWEEGFSKVGFNILLRESAGLSLSATKRAVDEILDDKPVYVEIPDGPAALEFPGRAANLGCRVAISPDRDLSSQDSDDRARGPLRLHG